MSNQTAPFQELTPDNHGPYVAVASISLIVITLCVTGIRFEIAWRARLKFELDDALFVMSTGFAVATSICFYRAVLAGLGRHQHSLVYVCQLLGIAAMATAKTSVVMLFRRIASTAHARYYITGGLIAVWAIFSFFALALQCSATEPWMLQPAHCSTHGYLQFPVIILNILTDAILALGVAPTIWNLQMRKSTRIYLICLFGSRIVVSLVAIGQLVAVAKSLHSEDQTWLWTSLANWDQFVIHLSVICTTIPRTHSFWASLQSGKVAMNITRQEIELNNSGHVNGKQAEMKSSILGRLQSRFNLRSTQNSFGNSFVPPNGASLSSHIYAGPVDQGTSHSRKNVREQTLMTSQMDDETSQSSLNQEDDIQGQGIWRNRQVTVEVEFQNKGDLDRGHGR